MSVLLSSLSMDVLYIVIDCQISHCVWCTLEQALASSFNSRIIQLQGSFQDLWQGDASVVCICNKQYPYLMNWLLLAAISLFDELVTIGRPIAFEVFNLYVFCGFHGEFKDLVTTAKLLSYIDLHSYLLTHEFIHKTSLLSMTVNPPLLPISSLLPYAHLAKYKKNPTSTIIEVVLVVNTSQQQPPHPPTQV